MLRPFAFILVLLMSNCSKHTSNADENKTIPPTLQAQIDTGYSNCTCKSYLALYRYRKKDYYTFGVDNYACDIANIFYDGNGIRIDDAGLNNTLRDQASLVKRMWQCAP